MKAIFGLGNYGPKYAGTRHNMGFDTVTRLSDKWKIPLDTKKFKGLCGFGWYNGEKVILIQPQTYMNNSGECVREICDFFKLTNKDIIVIYDDIDLPAGSIRIRKAGGAGTHNGMKSVENTFAILISFLLFMSVIIHTFMRSPSAAIHRRNSHLRTILGNCTTS